MIMIVYWFLVFTVGAPLMFLMELINQNDALLEWLEKIGLLAAQFI